MLHPELPAIVGYAEQRSVPIELNTNCGLITAAGTDALCLAGRSAEALPLLPALAASDQQFLRGTFGLD